jgi:hypothetical protein
MGTAVPGRRHDRGRADEGFCHERNRIRAFEVSDKKLDNVIKPLITF